jgi:hypothetical protein
MPRCCSVRFTISSSVPIGCVRSAKLAAAISRFVSLLDGLATGAFQDELFRKLVAADLATGQHRNPTNNPACFTTSYFHRPAQRPERMRFLSLVEKEPSIQGSSAAFLGGRQRLSWPPTSSRSPLC